MVTKVRPAWCNWCKRGPLEPTNSGTKLAFTRDHIQPKSVVRGRWVPACIQCNNLKGDIHPLAWMWFIDAHPLYYKTFRNTQQVKLVIARESARRVREGDLPLPRYPTVLQPIIEGKDQ